jgi:hypothetical protein
LPLLPGVKRVAFGGRPYPTSQSFDLSSVI